MVLKYGFNICACKKRKEKSRQEKNENKGLRNKDTFINYYI